MDLSPSIERNVQRLLAKAKACTVQQVGGAAFTVGSPSGSDYTVQVKPPHWNVLRHDCHCAWRERHPDKTCAHILAVELLLAQRENVHLSVWFRKVDALRQHRAIRVLGDLYITVRR